MTPFRALRGFRAQTTIIYGGLVVALATALSAAFGGMLAGQSHKEAGEALNVIAQNAARTLAAGLSERSQEVEVLAKSTELWTAGLASTTAAQAINRTRAARPYHAWIGVVDNDGVVQSGTDNLLVGASVKERPWFQEGLKGAHVGDVHKAKLLASLLPGLPSGEPLRFVDFSSPIVVDGQRVGVLGVHGSWEWARSVIETLLPAERASSQIEVFIFDRSGKVLFSPRAAKDDPEADKQQLPNFAAADADHKHDTGASFVYRWADGVRYLTASSSVTPDHQVADLGWTVVAREPTSIAFADARRSMLTALAIGAVGSVAAAFLAWFVSGMLSQPLTKIAEAARAVERGQKDAEIPVYGNNTEVARLSSALSGMTKRLLASNEELEAMVAERTKALQEAINTLNQLARHDPLTGLPNRRAFDERLNIALMLSKRQGTPVSLLMVDADHFKRVNDSHGHETGDLVLKELSRILAARVRSTDVVARMGGEEFAVLLPNTDEQGARMVADNLVKEVAGASITTVGRITISVGVATTFWVPDAKNILPRLADQALYAAKDAGRNRAHQFPAVLEAA